MKGNARIERGHMSMKAANRIVTLNRSERESNQEESLVSQMSASASISSHTPAVLADDLSETLRPQRTQLGKSGGYSLRRRNETAKKKRGGVARKCVLPS